MGRFRIPPKDCQWQKPQLPRAIKYIQNQEGHHKTRTFRDEYLALLKAHGIDYDERYIFKPIE